MTTISPLQTKIIDGIIEREGGYVNDPDDSGGETNYGIAKMTARRFGYLGDMSGMTRNMAFEIYSILYWDALSLDAIEKLSTLIAEEMADTAANTGTYRAAEFLQRSLNTLNNRGLIFKDIRVDGEIGPRTMTALTTFLDYRGFEGEAVLFRMLNVLQGAFYVDLAERRQKDEKFVYGWFLHRVT